ncbi:NAD(P)H-dependent oxidoreductase [Mesorhizobium sp. LSHC412B00]|uniref:NAD(P)H-dependent oxidoreductase n=1 Tax=Mesorhizobium sp. LSHC412B00 TaxID=1287285 RepID=UPI0003CEE298|nr:NAD(P)H-dependent oxidoreductase [Mesorhizobium sp. LSHC412B00]ESX80273.1 hypothetical protein X756_32900 [Mesorhizobium sp. LSHC412B00]
MQALIVHCHPEPTSFNSGLKGVATDTLTSLGYSVEISDLYAEGFDPVEKPEHYTNRKYPDFFAIEAEQRHASETGTLPRDVVREITRLRRADLVVFQFPLWNHGVPAMLKGWFDRVFVLGGIHTSRMRHDRGYFRGKRALCSITAGAGAAAFEPDSYAGDIDCLMYPINCELYYMGFSVLPPFLAYGVKSRGFGVEEDSEFCQKLEDIKAEWAVRLQSVQQTEPIAFPGKDDWDEDGRLKNSNWRGDWRARLQASKVDTPDMMTCSR